MKNASRTTPAINPLVSMPEQSKIATPVLSTGDNPLQNLGHVESLEDFSPVRAGNSNRTSPLTTNLREGPENLQVEAFFSQAFK